MAIGDPYIDAQYMIDRGLGESGRDEPTLNRACRVASRLVNKHCNRQFNTDDAVSARTYRPKSSFSVSVDDFHTTTGLVVKTDEDDDGTFETTWTLGTDFDLKPYDGIVNGIPGFPYWQIEAIDTKEFPESFKRALQVTANWGWAAVPDDVIEASLIAAEEIWKLKEAPFGVAGMGQFGSIRVRENSQFYRLLCDYRRESVRVA